MFNFKLKLEPCPFCKNKVRVCSIRYDEDEPKRYYIVCDDEDCLLFETKTFISVEDLIKKWNTRFVSHEINTN
jgi:hypothetical protein